MWKTLVSLVIILALALTVLYQLITLADVRAQLAYHTAKAGFIEAAALQGCVTREAMVAQAALRDWDVDNDPLYPGIEPDAWDSALWVNISPPFPFAKLPGTSFYFDADGCMIRQ